MPEKDIQVGSVGKLSLSFSGGKALVGFTGKIPGGVDLSFSASDDAGVLIDQIAAAVEKASPPGVVLIESTVFALMKSTVLAIK